MKSRWIKQSFFVAPILCVGTISTVVSLASCWEAQAKHDHGKYEIVCNDRFTGPKSGQFQQPLCLYENGEQCCSSDVSWKVINQENNGRVWIDQSTKILFWKDLTCNAEHSFEIAAHINDREIARKSVSLVVSEAIVGSTSFRGSYDQAGHSQQPYALIDVDGELIQDVRWSLEGETANKQIYLNEHHQLAWSAKLAAKSYLIRVVATKDGKQWTLLVRLSIVNNYAIQGESFINLGEAKTGSSQAYRLYQDGKLSTHKNYFWQLADVDKEYREIIHINDQGIVTWDGIVSSTSFRVVAKSREEGQKELATVAVFLKSEVKKESRSYFIGCNKEGQLSNNVIGYLNEVGSVQLTFYEGQKIYQDPVEWRLEDHDANISIDKDTGLISWNENLEARQYILVVEAFAKNDGRGSARNVYILDIHNPYAFSYEQTDYVCVSKKAGQTEKTFTLLRDDKKVTSGVTYEIQGDNSGSIRYNETSCRIEWDANIKQGRYLLKLVAKVDNHECAVAGLQIQALETYISGGDSFNLEPGATFSNQFNLIHLGQTVTKKTRWTLDSSSDEVFSLSNDAFLTANKALEMGTYRAKIVAEYETVRQELTIIVRVFSQQEYDIKGRGSFLCQYNQDVDFVTPFTLKDSQGQVVQDVTWELAGNPKEITMDSNGTIHYKAHTLIPGIRYYGLLSAYVNGHFCKSVGLDFLVI